MGRLQTFALPGLLPSNFAVQAASRRQTPASRAVVARTEARPELAASLLARGGFIGPAFT